MTSNAPRATSKTKIRGAIVLLFALVAVALCLYRNPFESQEAREKREFEALIEKRLVRGRELLRIAPQVKSEAWTEWYYKLPDDDQEAYGFALEEHMTPPVPSKVHKNAAHVKDYMADQQLIFPAKIITNYKPLLRVIGEMSVRPLRVETVRGPNGLISTMWAHRADGSIVVDWAAGTVKSANVPHTKSGGGPPPEWVSPFMAFCTNGSGAITMKFDQNTWVKLPWTRNSNVNSFAVDENYPYMFGREYGKESNTLESIVVADMQKKKIAGIIPVPAVNNGVHCIFDTKENYLMVLDSEWEWIILFDLSKPNLPADPPAPAKQ